jgi:hypothetical protein
LLRIRLSSLSFKTHFIQTVVIFNKLRNDPEGFQKISLAGLAAIQALRDWNHQPSSPTLDRLFNLVNSFDCYGFLAVPNQWLDPNQHSQPIFERLAQAANQFAALACLPVFFDEWKLIDFSHYADRIGRFRLFAWVPSQTLDQWVRVSLILTFTFSFLEACRLLLQKDLSSIQKTQVHWKLVAAAAEAVFNTSILLRCDLRIINTLTLIAKSLGVLSFIYSSQFSTLNE